VCTLTLLLFVDFSLRLFPLGPHRALVFSPTRKTYTATLLSKVNTQSIAITTDEY